MVRLIVLLLFIRMIFRKKVHFTLIILLDYWKWAVFWLYFYVCYSCGVTGKFQSGSQSMFPEKHVYFLGVCTHIPSLCLAPPPAGMIDRLSDWKTTKLTDSSANCLAQCVASLQKGLLIGITNGLKWGAGRKICLASLRLIILFIYLFF